MISVIARNPQWGAVAIGAELVCECNTRDYTHQRVLSNTLAVAILSDCNRWFYLRKRMRQKTGRSTHAYASSNSSLFILQLVINTVRACPSRGLASIDIAFLYVVELCPAS
jgi:hypothetical protein